MDTIKLNPTELAQAVAIAIASMKGVTLKDTLPSSTQAALHGSGGLFAGGFERNVFNANPAPQQGLAQKLRIRSSVHDTPLHAILLDQAANAGSHPGSGTCAPCKVPGALSKGVISFPWGQLCFSTDKFDLSSRAIGGLKDRGDFRDFTLVGSPWNAGVAPTTPASPNDPINSEISAMMMRFQHGWALEYGKLLYTGNPANNSGRYEEPKGLDILINTGYTDAVTSGSIAAADSIVSAFSGTLGTPADLDSTIVTKFVALWRRINMKARVRGLQVQYRVAMTERLFYEITGLWTQNYLTARVAADTDVQNTVRINMDARDLVAARDDMRTNSYLMVDGKRVDVTLDESITETALSGGDAGKYTSQIYFVPQVVNGVDAAYWEHFDYSNPETQRFITTMAQTPNFITTDNGRFLWVRRQDGYCISMDCTEAPRLVLETPFLAARMTDIKYTPSVVTESGY